MKLVPRIERRPNRVVRSVAHSLVRELKSGAIVDFVAVGIDSHKNARVYVGGNSSFTVTLGAVALLQDHLLRDFHGLGDDGWHSP